MPIEEKIEIYYIELLKWIDILFYYEHKPNGLILHTNIYLYNKIIF